MKTNPSLIPTKKRCMYVYSTSGLVSFASLRHVALQGHLGDLALDERRCKGALPCTAATLNMLLWAMLGWGATKHATTCAVSNWITFSTLILQEFYDSRDSWDVLQFAAIANCKPTLEQPELRLFLFFVIAFFMLLERNARCITKWLRRSLATQLRDPSALDVGRSCHSKSTTSFETQSSKRFCDSDFSIWLRPAGNGTWILKMQLSSAVFGVSIDVRRGLLPPFLLDDDNLPQRFLPHSASPTSLVPLTLVSCLSKSSANRWHVFHRLSWRPLKKPKLGGSMAPVSQRWWSGKNCKIILR